MHPPTLDDILRARDLIAGSPLHRTPTWRTAWLSEMTGADVRLKLELFQKTGSFKPRGAIARIAALDADERRRGVIAVSAGNHAQGVAYAAALAGVDATVVTWDTAPEVKLVATRAYGATTIRSGATPLLSFEAAHRLRDERGLVFVHPYDDPVVMAGQAGVVLEALEDVPELGTLVLPIGGGGLISGGVVAVRALRPDVRVVGVEPVGAPTLSRALEAGEPVPLEGAFTIADGLSAPIAGELVLPLVRDQVDDVVLVDDAEIRAAMRLLASRSKLVVEPAGAAAVAALLAGRVGEVDRRPVVVGVTGGNVEPKLFAEIMAEG